MNFNIEDLFGSGLAKMTALEECESQWKEMIKSESARQEKFWQAAKSAYDLLMPSLNEDSLPKELIGVYTLLHDFANDKNVQKESPVLAGIAEAISGIAAYSLVEIPIENARSVRAFCDDKEYIVNIDTKEIIEE